MTTTNAAVMLARQTLFEAGWAEAADRATLVAEENGHLSTLPGKGRKFSGSKIRGGI